MLLLCCAGLEEEKVKQETQFRQVPGLRDIVRVAAGLRHAAAVTREAHTFTQLTMHY